MKEETRRAWLEVVAWPLEMLEKLLLIYAPPLLALWAGLELLKGYGVLELRPLGGFVAGVGVGMLIGVGRRILGVDG